MGEGIPVLIEEVSADNMGFAFQGIQHLFSGKRLFESERLPGVGAYDLSEGAGFVEQTVSEGKNFRGHEKDRGKKQDQYAAQKDHAGQPALEPASKK